MAKKQYAAYLTVTLPDGVKKQLKFYGSTQKAANAKRDEAKVLNERGLLTFNDKTPLRAYAEEYHKTYVEPKCDAVNAQQNWKKMEDVFLSEIGHLPVSSIKRTHIVKCLNKTANKSKAYYDKAYGYAKALFNAAAADGLLINNPFTGLKREKRDAGKRRALTEKERQLIFPILQHEPKYAFYAVMLGCGLRPGEVAALTWPCVDFKNNTITVTQNKKSDGTIGSPKTKAGYRTVPMPEFLHKLLAGLPKNGAFVFSGNHVMLWRHFLHDLHERYGGKCTMEGKVKICADGIGADLMPYYLRHTFATMMAENDVPIKTAQKYMGHENATMIMEVYSHASEKMDRQAKEKMANMFAI